MCNTKPLTLAVREAVEILTHHLKGEGFLIRTDRSNASNSSAYVYVTTNDAKEVKIRISNHVLRKSFAFRHSAPDFELIVPAGKPKHIVEQIKAHFRNGKTP